MIRLPLVRIDKRLFICNQKSDSNVLEEVTNINVSNNKVSKAVTIMNTSNNKVSKETNMNTSNDKNMVKFVISRFFSSGILGWKMTSLLIDWLRTANRDIDRLCSNSLYGKLILTLISLCLLCALVFSIYDFIFSIGNANAIRNALWLVYHAVVFSAVLNVFHITEILAIIGTLIFAALSYEMHINTEGDRYYNVLDKRTLLCSAVCYGISASIMLNALASKYILNSGAYVLGFTLVFMVSLVTLFFTAAVKSAV